MAEVSRYIPAPYQGISQAPDNIRLLEQATSLVNVLVEVPEGLRKRPPLDYRGQVGVAMPKLADCLVQDPDTGATLHFAINGDPRGLLFDVSDQTSYPITITAPAAAYLSSGAPLAEDLVLQEAVDYTIIVNRKRQVTVDPSLNAARPYEALVFIKSSAYARTYTLKVQKTAGALRTGTMLTANGNSASSAQYVDTDLIAEWLLVGDGGVTTDGVDATGIGANLTTDGFTYSRTGSVIYITHASTDFTISITDGQGGVAADTLKGTTALFSNLPSKGAPDGFTIKIADTSAADSGYWVSYTAAGGWKESLGPGAEKGLLASTMPVGLSKVAGTWTIDVLPWKQRLVGDEDLALDPSFVGSFIQDIGYWSSRLVIVSSEELFLCASDDPFRCYPSTLTTPIDSDPIALPAPGKSRARFRYCNIFERALVLTGLKAQAIATAAPQSGGVTAGTVSLDELSRYDTTNSILRPISVGGKVYFAVPRSDAYQGLFELSIDRVSTKEAAEELTPAVPRLLPITVNKAAGIELHYFSVYGTSGSQELLIHAFRYANQERTQNAWIKWTLPEGWTLGGVTSFKSQLHFLLTNGLYLHAAVMDCSPLLKDPNDAATIQTYLDLRVSQSSCTVAYDAVLDRTTITPPLPVTEKTVVAAKAPGTDDQPEGASADVVSRSSTALIVRGDWRLALFYVGEAYRWEWQLSQIYIFGQDSRPLASGELILDRMELDLKNTSTLQVTVAHGTRIERVYTLGPYTVGLTSMFTGRWRVGLNGKAQDLTITVHGEDHVPAQVLGYEWFGDFNPQSSR